MINGGLMYLNEFQVDGAPNNAQFGNNVYGYSPPNEAVQESASRRTATTRSTGAPAAASSTSAPSPARHQFHAEGWTYLKRTGWNANSFQNNAIRAPRAPAPQTQWGLQVAGPSISPRFTPKSDRFKMFYLFSCDKYIEKLPNPLNLSYPAAEMRTGDFSKLTNSAGSRS
jgi:hypothetical protein